MYKWHKTIFVPKDFESSGQYIIKESINKENSPHIENSGYLSTIMYKIGYAYARKSEESNTYFLIHMSDGLIIKGYFSNTMDESGRTKNNKEWIWNEFIGTTNEEAKQKICNFLNENPYGDTYRFATNEEVVRVVMYQRGYRTKH